RAAAGVSPAAASRRNTWPGSSSAVMEDIAATWEKTKAVYAQARPQPQFSADFLPGSALSTDLTNRDWAAAARSVMNETGHELVDVLEAEHAAALGNGGLGRLAACFLDSAVTSDYPVTGYGLLYRYGLFRQSFEHGFQKEEPDA